MKTDSFTLTALLQSGLAWFILGAALFVVELGISGFLAVFFAVGAWITAILLWIGVIGGTWVPPAVFLVASVLSLFLLRERLRAVIGSRLSPEADSESALDEFRGKPAAVVETIDSSKNTGKVEFRGTNWPAQAEEIIAEGRTVRIVRRENLTLIVETIKE